MKGFTLAETIMVVTILVILTIISIPKESSVYSVKLSGTVTKLASDIRYTHQFAVTKQIALKHNMKSKIIISPKTENFLVQ